MADQINIDWHNSNQSTWYGSGTYFSFVITHRRKFELVLYRTRDEQYVEGSYKDLSEAFNKAESFESLFDCVDFLLQHSLAQITGKVDDLAKLCSIRSLEIARNLISESCSTTGSETTC